MRAPLYKTESLRLGNGRFLNGCLLSNAMEALVNMLGFDAFFACDLHDDGDDNGDGQRDDQRIDKLKH